MTKRLSFYLFVYTLSIILYIYLNINNLKQNIYENAEYFVKNSAKGIRYIISDDYIERARDPNGINKKEFEKNNKRILEFIKGTEVKKVYTLFYYGSDFFYTSLADKNNENSNISYFSIFEGNQEQIFDISNSLQIKILKNEDYITAIIPQISENATAYVICIDYSLDYLEKKFKNHLITFMLTSIFLAIMTITFLAFYKNTHQVLHKVEKELKKIKEIKKELNKNKVFFEEKAKTDSLTKIYNKEYIHDFYFNRCREFNGTPFVVMFMDLDKFKEINDTYGHYCGDKVLTGVTREVSKRVKDLDAFGRIGGDEFMIVFYNANLEKGKELARKIVNDINNLEFLFDDKIIKISCSIGFLQYGGQEPQEFLKRVDDYLYIAKEERNRFATKEID